VYDWPVLVLYARITVLLDPIIPRPGGTVANYGWYASQPTARAPC
jgi:hypothetical protein